MVGRSKNFFMLRDYLKVLNSCAITPQFELKIVALAYRKTKTHFKITIIQLINGSIILLVE